MVTEPTIYDYGFDTSLNKITNDIPNPNIFNSPETGVNAQVLSGGLVTSKSTGSTNNPGIQIGIVQTSNGSNLAPFDVANDGTGNIRRVGAIKIASAGDLGISTLSPAPTANKVIYATNSNNLHINAPGASGSVHLDINGQNYLSAGVDTMVYATSMTLDTTLPNLHKTTTTNAVGNATINASDAGRQGQVIYILIINDATANRTITFGTYFKPTGTLVGTINKAAIVTFVTDQTNWYEVTRTTGL